MAETRHFLNLVLARLNLPMPEPERSEALEYFNFVDFGKDEFYLMWSKKEELNASEEARFKELIKLRNKYVCSGRYEYYLEADDDGGNDSLIQHVVSTYDDNASFSLNERQRKIAMDLIELHFLNVERKELDEKRKKHIWWVKLQLPKCELSAADFEKVLKWRYLSMKYGRQKRLAKQKLEEESLQRRIDAACLGPGFTIDW